MGEADRSPSLRPMGGVDRRLLSPPRRGRVAGRQRRAPAMSRYLIRRTLGAIVVMWAVATLVFFMLRAVPGDPLAAMLFDVADPQAAEALREKFGLDQPVWVQYVKWFALVLQGDFGTPRSAAASRSRGCSSRRCPGRCRLPRSPS